MQGFARRVVRRGALAVAAMMSACDSPPDYETEKGQIGLRGEGLDGESVDRPRPSIDAVVGSRVCLTFDGWFEEDGAVYHTRTEEPDDAWLRECFALEPSAGLRLDGSCLVLEGVGQGKLGLSPTSCELDDAPEFVADALPVRAYGVDELALSYPDLAAYFVETQDPGPAEAFPPRPPRAAGTPMRVLAGSPYLMTLQPVTRGTPNQAVAYSDGVEQFVGDAPVQFVASSSGAATLVLDVDQRLRLQLALPAGTLEGDEVVGVDPALATELEIIAGYTSCPTCEDGYGLPSFAYAVIRDAEGGELFGGDVRWSIDGAGAVSDELLDPSMSQLVMIESGCNPEDAGAERSAVLRAELGDLAAEVELAYTCPEEEDDDGDDWGAEIVDGDPPESDLGCGCDAQRRDAPVGSLAVVVLGLLARRRRR